MTSQIKGEIRCHWAEASRVFQMLGQHAALSVALAEIRRFSKSAVTPLQAGRPQLRRDSLDNGGVLLDHRNDLLDGPDAGVNLYEGRIQTRA